MDDMRVVSRDLRACDDPDAFTDAENIALKVIPSLGSTFSLLGAIFIIFTYFYIPKLQRIPYRLIMYMSIADGMSAFSYLFGVAANSEEGISCDRTSSCYFQAAMSQFFETAGMFWIFIVALHIYIVMYVYQAEAQRSQLEALEKYYHVIGWGIPGILLIIAISADVFGDSGQWCWISPDYQWARVALYYFWLILILFLNAVMFYIIVKYNPLQTRQEAASKRVSRNFRHQNPLAFRLRLYLLAFICTKLFSVINRVQNIADGDNPIFTLYMLQALFEPFTGFANAMVYGANKMVINSYKRKWEEYKKERAANAAFSSSSYDASSTTTTTNSPIVKKSDIETNIGNVGDNNTTVRDEEEKNSHLEMEFTTKSLEEEGK